jgi:hypothetical protein
LTLAFEPGLKATITRVVSEAAAEAAPITPNAVVATTILTAKAMVDMRVLLCIMNLLR